MQQLSNRKLLILKTLRRYPYLRTAQIRDATAPKDEDGRITRSNLCELEALGLVRRHNPKMVDPFTGQAAPISVLTIKGSNWLTAETGDCSLLLQCERTFTDWMSLNHHCEVCGLHMKLDRAFAKQARMKLLSLHFEHDVVGKGPKPEDKYKLYEVLQENPRIVCNPDSAMVMEIEGYTRLLLQEFETGRDGSPQRVASKKIKGLYHLFQKKAWKKKFPEALDAYVLFFCPNTGWMNGLRKSFRDVKETPCGDNWLFCPTHKIDDDFLSKPLIYKLNDDHPFPLVPPACGPTQDRRSELRPDVRPDAIR